LSHFSSSLKVFNPVVVYKPVVGEIFRQEVTNNYFAKSTARTT